MRQDQAEWCNHQHPGREARALTSPGLHAAGRRSLRRGTKGRQASPLAVGALHPEMPEGGWGDATVGAGRVGRP